MEYKMRIVLPIAVFGLYVLSPTLASADCLADFNAVIHNNLDVGPYEADGLIQLADSATGAKAEITTVTQVVLPNSVALHMVNGANHSQTDLVVAAGKGWIKKDGHWLAMPEAAARQAVDTVRNNGFTSSNLRNVQCLGTKTLDGKPMLAFSFDNAEATMTLYADPASRLPVRVEGSGNQGTRSLVATVTFRFDSVLKIEAPKTE
jgi:hypothetical protein